jgi:uncharacterized protein YlxW (UPF0749 family)
MRSSIPGWDGLPVTLVGVSTGSHARSPGSPDPEQPRRPRAWLPERLRPTANGPQGGPGRGPWWRIGTPLVVLACGTLFVVSAASSDGTDLRPGRYTDLAALVDDEADAYADLQTRFTELDAEVNALSSAVSDNRVSRLNRRIERLEDPAGLVPRSGQGVRLVLSDAPEDLINSTTGDVNDLLVHQQDIQAAVNALWKGGATAVTIQGQRVVSTTGIKCEGNSVQLQGVPYPQPYVIEAVGDQDALVTAIENDTYLQGYQEDAADPDVAVGWDLDLENLLVAPAYDGLLDLNYAQPLPTR